MNSFILFEKYFFWLVLYSFIGWIYESLLESFRQKKPVNRGFLFGPYLPIYGSGALLDVLILGQIKNPLILFLLSAFLTCILEYLASLILEKLFGLRWWDYNDFKFIVKGKEIDVGKFNINGRVCLVGWLAFGTLSIVLVLLIHPLVERVTNLIPHPYFDYFCIILMLLVTVDIVMTVISLTNLTEKLQKLSSTIEQFRDGINSKMQSMAAYEKINSAYSKFTRSLNEHQKRWIRSFPALRWIKYREVTDEIKKFFFHHRDKSTSDRNDHTDDIDDIDIIDDIDETFDE